MPYVAPGPEDEGDLLTGFRTCRRCEARKAMTEFHWINKRRHRARVCKDCQYKDAKARRALDPERYSRAHRVRTLAVKYGLTVREYNEMYYDQKGNCAICDDTLPPSAHVDHNHETGQVRDLLCLGCNIGLGAFKEDSTRLWEAIHYLARHEFVPSPTDLDPVKIWEHLRVGGTVESLLEVASSEAAASTERVANGIVEGRSRLLSTVYAEFASAYEEISNERGIAARREWFARAIATSPNRLLLQLLFDADYDEFEDALWKAIKPTRTTPYKEDVNG